MANVFFGNCDALKETFKDILDKGGEKVSAVVIDAAGRLHRSSQALNKGVPNFRRFELAVHASAENSLARVLSARVRKLTHMDVYNATVSHRRVSY